MILLAQSELDDWVKIVILVLFIGGSTLGALAKKLIAYFGPKEDQSGKAPRIPTVVGDDRTRPRQQPRPVARPAPTLPTAHPAPSFPPPRPAPSLPSARPAPPARQASKAPTMRPVAKPQPLEQPAKPTLADLVQEVFEQQHSDVARVPADTASPPPVRPVAPREAPQTKKRRSQREAKRIASAKKQRSGQVKPSAASGSEQEGVDPEKHLGRLQSKIPKQTEQATAPAADSFRRPSKDALRRAIIMSEVLRPPLALRADDDTGF